MRKTGWKAVVFVFVLFILATGKSTDVSAETNETSELEEKIVQSCQSLGGSSGLSCRELLADAELLPAGSSLSDWTAIAFAIAGVDADYEEYLSRLEEYVTECYQNEGGLSETKATEYHRIALTVLALGGDPLAFGEDQKGTPINLIADGIYNFQGDSVGAQGNNGLIYALITLDAKAYEVPEGAKFTRESILEELLAGQNEDGSFALSSGGAGDVDITAMALQALGGYQENEDAKTATDAALSWLSEQMTDYGTFLSYGAESAESSAQALLALCALGIDPETDDMFEKNNMTLMRGLESFRMEDGSYCHTLSDGESNYMATQQSLLALEAVWLLQKDGAWLFDFTDYQGPPAQSGGGWTAAAAVILVLLAAAGIWRIKKSRKREE